MTQLRVLLPGCPRLVTLDLTGCSSLQALPYVFERLHGRLQSLTLNFVPNITDQSLEALATHLAPLRIIRLGGTSVTDFGVQQLLYRCSRLIELDLYACYAVTDLAFASVDTLCPTLQRLVCKDTAGLPSTLCDNFLLCWGVFNGWFLLRPWNLTVRT